MNYCITHVLMWWQQTYSHWLPPAIHSHVEPHSLVFSFHLWFWCAKSKLLLLLLLVVVVVVVTTVERVLALSLYLWTLNCIAMLVVIVTLAISAVCCTVLSHTQYICLFKIHSAQTILWE